jgi:hypothetical protein
MWQCGMDLFFLGYEPVAVSSKTAMNLRVTIRVMSLPAERLLCFQCSVALSQYLSTIYRYNLNIRVLHVEGDERYFPVDSKFRHTVTPRFTKIRITKFRSYELS